MNIYSKRGRILIIFNSVVIFDIIFIILSLNLKYCIYKLSDLLLFVIKKKERNKFRKNKIKTLV